MQKLKTKHPCRTALITGSFTPSSTPTLLTKVILGTNLVFSSLPSGIMSQTVLQTFPPFTYLKRGQKHLTHISPLPAPEPQGKSLNTRVEPTSGFLVSDRKT